MTPHAKRYRDPHGVEHSFNKLVVFDKAHKYIESPDLVAGLIEVVREMRHKGTSIMVASQDPPSVPIFLIELSSQIILHKFNSPAWLKHIQKANAALGALTPEKMANLRPGEAFAWSSKATDEAFTKGAVEICCRPRVTHHGGATKTAVASQQLFAIFPQTALANSLVVGQLSGFLCYTPPNHLYQPS